MPKISELNKVELKKYYASYKKKYKSDPTNERYKKILKQIKKRMVSLEGQVDAQLIGFETPKIEKPAETRTLARKPRNLTGSSERKEQNSPKKSKNTGCYYDGSFFGAVGLATKTMPFFLARVGIMMAFAVASLIYWGIVTALFGGGAYVAQKAGVTADKNSVGAMFYVYMFAMFAPAGAFWWMRRYVLYVLNAAHIAVLTEAITTDEIPSNMISYGKEKVTKNFAQISVFFAIDAMVEGVVKAFNATLNFFGSFIPIPGVSDVLRFLNTLVRMATTFVDECVLSYNFTKENENPWQSSVDGLVLYAQNATSILKTAVWAVVLDYFFTFVGSIILAGVFGFVGTLVLKYIFLPQIIYVMYGMLAYTLHSCVLQPLFQIMILGKYHSVTVDQVPQLEWQDRLSKISNKFKDMLGKASKDKSKMAA